MNAEDIAMHNMVDNQLRANGILNPQVLQAFKSISRAKYIPVAYQAQPYCDDTIQINPEARAMYSPIALAFLLQSLEIQINHKVCLLGCNYGYTLALLAQFGCDVYAFEDNETFYKRANKIANHKKIHIFKTSIVKGDPCHGPFDRLIWEFGNPGVLEPYGNLLVDGGLMAGAICSQEKTDCGHIKVYQKQNNKLVEMKSYATKMPIYEALKKHDQFAF